MELEKEEIKSESDQSTEGIQVENQCDDNGGVVVINLDNEEADREEVMAPVYVHRKPEAYSGSNPEEFDLWLQKFRAVAAAQEWGDDEAIRNLIPVYLSGHAFQLYTTLDVTQKNTYANLIKNLKLKLGLGENSLQWRLRLHRTSRDQGEAVDTYVLRLKNIVSHGYPDLQEDNDAFKACVVEQFILGQPKDLRFHLLKKEGTPTLAELIMSTKVYEMASEIALGTKATRALDTFALESNQESERRLIDPRIESEIESVTNRFSEIECQEQQLNAATLSFGGNRGHGRLNPQYVAESRQGFGTTPGASASQSFSCFRCGQAGHMARECSAQVIQGNRAKAPVCFNCRKPGHISRFCSSTQASMSNAKPKQNPPPITNQEFCQRCGNRFHKAESCRTDISIVCQYCQKKGHLAEVCRSVPRHGAALEWQRDYIAGTPTTKNDHASVPKEVDWS